MISSLGKSNNVKLKYGDISFPSTVLLDLTCILWFCSMPMRVVISTALAFIGLRSFNRLFAGMIIFLPLLLYIALERKLPWKYFHWIFFACALFFGVTLILHPDYITWYIRDDFGVMYAVLSPDHGAVWAFLMIEISQTPERLWNNIKWIAAIIGVYNLYRLLIAISVGYWGAYDMHGNISENTYSLDFGYDMIFVFLVAFVCYLSTRKVYFIIVDLIAVSLALKYGSRGAFICIIVFFALYLLNGSFAKWKRVLYAFIIVVSGGLLYQYGERLAIQVASGLLRSGVSSRTLEMILSGGITDDSGRSAIYKLAQTAILKSPFVGYGAYGDRPIIGPYYYWGYCHNIIYEMMIDFGIIIGCLFLIIFLYRSFKFIFVIKDKELNYIYLIMFSMCMRLLVSDTFWGNRFFWMSLAILFMYHKKIIGNSIRKAGRKNGSSHSRIRFNVY